MTASKASSPAVEKLRPCPFCSAQMKIVSGMGLYARHPHPTDCMVSGITAPSGWFDKWNRRPEHDRLAEEVGRLQEAKRRALALADTRAKESAELRQEVGRLRADLAAIEARTREECAVIADQWADRADRLLTGDCADTAHQTATVIAATIRARPSVPGDDHE